MAEKKRQHFVPRFYMRLFSNNGRIFCIYDMNNRTIRSDVPLSNQCKKDYLYGHDIIWENYLQKLESSWGALFQRLALDNKLNYDDMCNLRKFALFQRERTLAENDYRTREREALVTEIVKQICFSKGWEFDEDAKEFCKEKLNDFSIPDEQLSFAENFESVISDLSVLVISYNTSSQLVSSDVPVIAINPFYPPSIGYGCIGLILLFPISPSKLVVLYDSKMYPRFRNDIFIESNDCEEVKHLNMLQYISAGKILFAHSNSAFDFISNVAEEARKKHEAKNPLAVLGAGNNRIFATTMRTIDFKYDWSFAQISHRFKRIPFVCKNAFPRKRDYEIEKNLDFRIEALCMMFNESPQTFASYNITAKELRRGCHRMSSAIRVYWTQNNVGKL